jgi:hypothetical protein
MKWLATVLLGCALPTAAAGQLQEDPRVSELHHALIPVHSIDAAERDYSDLRGFASSLGGVRVLFRASRRMAMAPRSRRVADD